MCLIGTIGHDLYTRNSRTNIGTKIKGVYDTLDEKRDEKPYNLLSAIRINLDIYIHLLTLSSLLMQLFVSHLVHRS